ncbi:MAG: hypothetical protein R3C61_01065 [Bacteroidia bacterium]
MKKNIRILIFLLGFSPFVLSGCGSAVDESSQREDKVSESQHQLDSADTEALLDSLAAETDSIREALDLERNLENAADGN